MRVAVYAQFREVFDSCTSFSFVIWQDLLPYLVLCTVPKGNNLTHRQLVPIVASQRAAGAVFCWLYRHQPHLTLFFLFLLPVFLFPSFFLLFISSSSSSVRVSYSSTTFLSSPSSESMNIDYFLSLLFLLSLYTLFLFLYFHGSQVFLLLFFTASHPHSYAISLPLPPWK